MKVFGIGLSRTGTTSFTTVLNKYGLDICHYPVAKQIKEIREGKHDGACDISVIPYYKEFDKLFPGAKFVYTIRDKKSWIVSAERHFLRKGRYVRPWQSTIRREVYGRVYFNRNIYRNAYDKHDKNVREYFKGREQDLLILDICGGDKMGKLFSFLEIEHENGHLPFPQTNKRK